MKVLAIDQSSTINGWAVMEDEKLIGEGLIVLTGKSNRLFRLKQEVEKLYLKYNPDEMLWENLKGSSFGRGKKGYSNPDTTRVLGEVTGVLRCFAEESGVPYTEYVPSTVKSVCCGTNDKVILGYYIAEKYEIEIPKLKSGKNKGELVSKKSHRFFNRTDAIALGLCHFLKKNRR